MRCQLAHWNSALFVKPERCATDWQWIGNKDGQLWLEGGGAVYRNSRRLFDCESRAAPRHTRRWTAWNTNSGLRRPYAVKKKVSTRLISRQRVCVWNKHVITGVQVKFTTQKRVFQVLSFPRSLRHRLFCVIAPSPTLTVLSLYSLLFTSPSLWHPLTPSLFSLSFPPTVLSLSLSLPSCQPSLFSPIF